MHGYEPPKQRGEGSWGESAALTLAVFQTLFGPLAMIAIVLGLVIAMMIALFSEPILAIIPFVALVLITVYFIRRDKRVQQELQDEIGPT